MARATGGESLGALAGEGAGAATGGDALGALTGAGAGAATGGDALGALTGAGAGAATGAASSLGTLFTAVQPTAVKQHTATAPSETYARPIIGVPAIPRDPVSGCFQNSVTR